MRLLDNVIYLFRYEPRTALFFSGLLATVVAMIFIPGVASAVGAIIAMLASTLINIIAIAIVIAMVTFAAILIKASSKDDFEEPMLHDEVHTNDNPPAVTQNDQATYGKMFQPAHDSHITTPNISSSLPVCK